MAMVTKRKSNTGEIFANAFQNVAANISNAILKSQELKQQREFEQAKLDQIKQDSENMNYKKYMDSVAYASSLDNASKKAYLETHGQMIEKFAKNGGLSTTLPEITKFLNAGESYANTFQSASGAANDFVSAVQNPDRYTETQIDALETRFNNAYSDLYKISSPQQIKEHEVKKQYVLEKIGEIKQKQRDYALRARNTAANEKLAGIKAGETTFAKTVSKTQGEDYAKALNDLPRMQQSIQNLQDATKLVDRVFVGPLAGKSISFGLQRVSSEDAQRLDYYLNKQTVQSILDFAGKAGVRGIDTPAEQQRILSTVPNKEQSPKVLKEFLVKMQKIQEEAIALTLDKQDYLRSNPDLSQYLPPQIRKKSKKQISANDIDNMNAEELEAFLGE